jgi:hypothetical protein
MKHQQFEKFATDLYSKGTTKGETNEKSCDSPG